MGTWNVEVEGRYTAVIEVEAEGSTEAEELAISAFEQDYDVVTNMGAESWDYTGICGTEEVEEEEEDQTYCGGIDKGRTPVI